MANNSKPLDMPALVKRAVAAKKANDVLASNLIQTAAEALARSEAAALEARLLASFVDGM